MIGRPRFVVVALLLLTALLALPMALMEPDETASQSPANDVSAAQDLISERFAGEAFGVVVLVEAVDGEILDKASLLELLRQSTETRSDPEIGDLLLTDVDPELGVEVHGFWTIADSADLLLREVGVADGLEGADEAQVQGIVAALVEQAGPEAWGLAAQANGDAAGWHSPALFLEAVADNERLGGGGFLATIGTANLDKEQFARDLTDSIVGDGHDLRAWSPAADVNLTSNEQGETAGPYVAVTIAAVLLIVGFVFRTYWAVAVAGAALGMLMVWLNGGSNLIGFKSDQILSTILPISMISFGIDAAFHGIGRVREEQQRGLVGSRAFVVGLGAVFGALALAAASDAAAFLSNTAAGIESVVQFGFAAALATVASFALLGLATPLVVALIENATGRRTLTRFGYRGDMALSLLAATMASATVLVLVFVSTPVGLGLLASYMVIALAIPFLVSRRSESGGVSLPVSSAGSRRLGATVERVSARPLLTLALAAIVTAAAVWSALQLEVTFDVNDFFSPDSDFVVALDKTADYLGDQGGEPALVYIEGDLTDPAAVEAVRLFTDTVAQVDDSPLAVDISGDVRVDRGVLALIDDVAGVVDVDSIDGLAMLYTTGLGVGIPDASNEWTPDDVGTVLWQSADGSRQATVLGYQIPDTRDQENITRTRQLLEPAALELEASLAALDDEAQVVVTGSAVYRDEQLAAIRRAMLLALPIALGACFVIAAVFMRSIRYAFVSVIPIVVVVAWLYGLMHQSGYSINVVTSIIGAVSIGIGIDFSTHFTMRFLSEHRSGLAKRRAVAAAGVGTGSALFGSAITSIAGFGVLAFAPMPMFASYGLLTAVMIGLALIASLYVLPSLLLIVTRDRGFEEVSLSLSEPLSIGLAVDLPSPIAARLRSTPGRGASSVVLPADALIEKVREESLDVAVVRCWPGQHPSQDVTAVVLGRDEIVAVSGTSADESPVSAATLAHGLVVTGETGEISGRLNEIAPGPLLLRSSESVASGVLLARLTGGRMVTTRSSASDVALGSMSPLVPSAWIDLVVLVSAARFADPGVAELVMAWAKGLENDGLLELMVATDA